MELATELELAQFWPALESALALEWGLGSVEAAVLEFERLGCTGAGAGRDIVVSFGGRGTTPHHRLRCGGAECGEGMETVVLGLFGCGPGRFMVV